MLHRKQLRPKRPGATTVEVAVSIGILFTVMFASLEFTRVNMIRHTVDHACYEACRRGIVPGATVQDVEDEANHVLGIVGTQAASVNVQPTFIDDETPEVTVSVTVLLDNNGWVAPVFFAGKSITRELTLARELHVTAP